MLFNSFDFFLFLIIVLFIYWILPSKYRWILLLLSSYFFYAQWNASYLLLLIFTTFLDFFLSIKLTSSPIKIRRKLGITLSVIMNLGVLFLFKYFNFFQQIITDIVSCFDIKYTLTNSELLLPVGISFYTFQVLSYSIDVYRKTIEPERNIGKFALFVSFFPQLVAGPIERAKDLIPQVNKLKHTFNQENLKIGLTYIIWGLFQKVAVADNISILVDKVYENPMNANSGLLIFTSLLFSIQIYTDFAGYSNMAIGIAKLFDYNLIINFNSPYISSSITSFWKKWHISLSNWVKDYIYIPLGGNRVLKHRIYFNLIITFFIVGLWHGASYNFLIWGLLNGILLIIERLFNIRNESKNKIINFARMIFIFFLISLIWIPFRSQTLGVTFYIYRKILTDFNLFQLKYWINENISSLFTIPIIILIIIEILTHKLGFISILSWKKNYKIIFYLIIIFSIIFLGQTKGGAFIYFQF